MHDLLTVTVDNAAANDTAFGYLKKKFNNIRDGHYMHVRCIAHSLNLIVKKGLSDLYVSVSRVRGAVKFVRQSPARLQKFKDLAKAENVDSKALLCSDVCTRWNSAYLMLKHCTKI